MNPFDQNFANQFISDMYASSAYYASQYYYIPEEPVNFWNVNTINDAPLIIRPFEGIIVSDYDQNTKTQLKPTRAHENEDNDPSISCKSADE
jgi:hypothetical protein